MCKRIPKIEEYKKPNILEFIDEKMSEGLTEEEAALWYDSLFGAYVENEKETKEYVFNYKVKTIPFWYVWTCYAESKEKAVSAFLHENMIGLETYRIVKINNI